MLLLFAFGSSAGNAKNQQTKNRIPLFRLKHEISDLKPAPDGRYLAFREHHPSQGPALKYLDLKTRQIFRITDAHTGAAFIWSPHGYRLLYRTQHRSGKGGSVFSKLMIRDVVLRKNILVRRVASKSSLLTIDPYDFKIWLMGEKRVFLQKLSYPGSRLANWQKRQRRQSGFWIATQNGILWVDSQRGTMKKLKDDGSALGSFSISPDGTHIAWSTKKNAIFWHSEGQNTRFLDYGRNPVWHPARKVLLYSGAHRTGPVTAGYDLKISSLAGSGQWVTSTPYSQENWPSWLPNENLILFTADHTSDLFIQDLNHEIDSRTIAYSR